MHNQPTPEELARLPGLYETEHVALEDKVIHMRFLLGGCDWHIAECDPEERILFGHVILDGDRSSAEWGNMSLDELAGLRTAQGFEVYRDAYWQPVRFRDIPGLGRA